MQEYQVCLKHVNKRFALPMAVRREQILELIKNVLRVHVWFKKVLHMDINILNLDQMPLHRNESSIQTTLSFKDQETYVKDNYMLSRDRITCLTILSAKDGTLAPTLCSKARVRYKTSCIDILVSPRCGHRRGLTAWNRCCRRWKPSPILRREMPNLVRLTSNGHCSCLMTIQST